MGNLQQYIQQHLAAAREHLAEIRRAHPDAYRASIIASISLALIISAGCIWFVYDIVRDLPSRAQLRDISAMAQATTLYDKDNHVAFTIFQERRVETPLADISPHLVKAVIAIEDQRFYDHGGVDPIRIFAAARNNLRQHRADRNPGLPKRARAMRARSEPFRLASPQ